MIKSAPSNPTIRDLRETHYIKEHIEDINNFNCQAEPQVEHFLKNEAIDLYEKNLVRTRLFFDDEKLIGFYSLFNDSIMFNKQKRQEMGVKLPKHVKSIPSLRLHYFGIDDNYARKGYGRQCLLSAFYHASNIGAITGCTLLIVESTPNAMLFYKKFGFTYIQKTNCGKFFLMALNMRPLLNLKEKFERTLDSQ